MNRRIIGLETEYGLACSDSQGAHVDIDPSEIARSLFADMQQASGATSAFLINGGRLYLDVGDHPEYATAECQQIIDLASQNRAGDQLLRDMADKASATLGYHIHLFKNNVDTASHSYGCHENYLVRRRRDFLDRLAELVPFFVTRQLLVGAGYVHREPGTVRFEVSQRARHMHNSISTSSTRTRPMINTRDEPHADADKYRRMHVIVGDSNMSDTTTLLKTGMTHAVLNVMEDGVRLPAFPLADPMQAIRSVAQDLSGNILLPLADGSTIRAIDIQRKIFDTVLEHYTRQGWLAGLDETTRYVFDLWGRALDAFATSNFSTVHTEIEWIAKYELITRYRHRHNVALSDDRITRLELAWHDISAGGLRDRLEQIGILARRTTPSMIRSALDWAPNDSRASIRAKFIQVAQLHHRDYAVDWGLVRLFNDGSGTTISLTDPFAPENGAVDSLIESMEKQ
ncbi:proteasome accessory factor PafA2 family protein [Arcanobacterium phocae]|uniref:proteasome accessory factor PafA2 family protein n=1 Tax=Arcanobacterium phocae TaxID=131112 RepID=UPI0027E018DC|nr:proteasome accessory factor PafA2 family protein [Arcanobacterium phocae]